MPYINIRVSSEMTPAQRAQLTQRITAALVEVLGVPAEQTQIKIEMVEVPNSAASSSSAAAQSQQQQ